MEEIAESDSCTRSVGEYIMIEESIDLFEKECEKIKTEAAHKSQGLNGGCKKVMQTRIAEAEWE